MTYQLLRFLNKTQVENEVQVSNKAKPDGKGKTFTFGILFQSDQIYHLHR